MFIFHFICYGVLFLKTFDVQILALYVAQAVFFKLLIFIYEHIYADCSRIMMNHICFLLLIGFVMLTRLDFEDAVVDVVAERNGANCILTRNIKDFAGSVVPAILPADFLSR